MSSKNIYVPKKSFGVEYICPANSLSYLSPVGSSNVKSVADVQSKLQGGNTAVYFKLARRPWNTEIVVYSKGSGQPGLAIYGMNLN